MKEFDLIKNYFSEQVIKRKDVVLGIGDDCALVMPVDNQQLAITTDTLVAGVHFPENTQPKAIGYKALAVNLSDLAAMGAEPAWISLALTLPEVNMNWMEEFCEGIFELCNFYNVQLIGGDTTQGPLSITITAQGNVPQGKAIRRSGARIGDWIYVTGRLGDAALALKHIKREVTVPLSHMEPVLRKLDFPKPRVLAGQAIRAYATSAIDLSDGVISDLGHICTASNVGANIVLDNLPVSSAMKETLSKEEGAELALTGGDDYELLFTVNEHDKVGMETALANTGNLMTCIGQITASNKITLELDGKPFTLSKSGYEHFSA